MKPNDQEGELLSALMHGPKNTKSRASQQDLHRMGTSGRSTPVTRKSSPSTQQVQKDLQAMPMAKDPRGQKRKAHEPLVPPPTSRRKTDQHATRRTHSLQAARQLAEQIPNVPRELLETPKQALEYILKGYAQVTSVFSQSRKSPSICTLVCSFPGGKQIATTKGQDRKRVRLGRCACVCRS